MICALTAEHEWLVRRSLLAIRSVAVTGSDWVLPETGCKTSGVDFLFPKGARFLAQKAPDARAYF